MLISETAIVERAGIVRLFFVSRGRFIMTFFVRYIRRSFNNFTWRYFNETDL